MKQDRTEKVHQLLSAARSEFARAGLRGARVDDIARAAGMNKRLLYHYVGDKEALFDAVLAQSVERILMAPEDAHPDEWRLVCHGVAEDRLPDLSGVLAKFEGAGGAAGMGLVLLTSLLPEAADRLLGNPEGERGRQEALRRSLAHLTPTARPPKPRLKLRPDLRTGPAGDVL